MNHASMLILAVLLGMMPAAHAQNAATDVTADIAAANSGAVVKTEHDEKTTESNDTAQPNSEQLEDEQQPQESMQEIQRQPSQSSPAEASGPQRELETLPEPLDRSKRHMDQLRKDIYRDLVQPARPISCDELKDQLDRLIDNASQFARIARSAKSQFEAYNVQLNAMYCYIHHFPHSEEVPRMISRMRMAGQRARAIRLPDAPAIGDYWLMMTQLIEVKRSDASADEKRAAMNQLLVDYLAKNAKGPISDDVQATLDQLDSGNDNSE